LRNSMAYRAGALQSTLYRDLDLLERAVRVLRRQGHHTSLVIDIARQIDGLKSLLDVVDPEGWTDSHSLGPSSQAKRVL